MSDINNIIIPGNGELSKQFFEMQKDISPDYVIEVGAHAAEFSLAMANKFSIPATAFEAGKKVYDAYSDQINSDMVLYLNYAISDVDGIVTFKVTNDQMHGNSGIVERVNFEHTETEEVKSYKLDTYFKDAKFENACLWIDVEGASRQVLTNATEVLKKVSSIFIETEDQEYWKDQWLTDDVVSFLSLHGFVKLAAEKVYAAQQNIIFIRRENDYKTS